MYINFSVLCTTPACLLCMISYPESSEARTAHTHAQLFTVQINCFVVEAVISVRCIYRKRRTAPCPFQFKLDRVLILIFSTKIHFMKAYLTSEWKLNTWTLRGAYVFTQFVWFGTHTHTHAYTCSKHLGRRLRPQVKKPWNELHMVLKCVIQRTTKIK